MSVIIGSAVEEINTIPITLAANASSDLFPNNSNTHFRIKLPYEISTGRQVPALLLRLRKIYVAKQILPDDDLRVRIPTDIMQVRIQEIVPQFVNSKSEHIAGIFNIRHSNDIDPHEDSPDNPDWFKDLYLIHEFENNSCVRLSEMKVEYLTISLTTILGSLFPLKDQLPPTIIELDITAMDTTRAEMSLYCMSHAKDEQELFPSNTLTNFRVKLSQPINLSQLELSLKSITFPALPHPDFLTAKLQLNFGPDKNFKTWTSSIMYRYPVLEDSTQEEVAAAFIEFLTQDATWSKFLSLDATYDREGKLKTFIARNKDEGNYILIIMNSTLSSLLGQGYSHATTTLKPHDPLSRNRGKNLIGKDKIISVSEFFLPPIAFMYCNVLQPSPVGDTVAPLLEIIPITKFYRNSNRANRLKMFEPKRLQFRKCQETEVSELHFQLLRADGKPIHIPQVRDNLIKQNGGTLLELKIQPQKSYEVSNTNKLNKFRFDWMRDQYK